MVDTKGYFKPEFAYFNGMLLGNATEIKIFAKYVDEDAADNLKYPYYDVTSGREKMLGKQRIELLFDYRGKYIF